MWSTSVNVTTRTPRKWRGAFLLLSTRVIISSSGVGAIDEVTVPASCRQSCALIYLSVVQLSFLGRGRLHERAVKGGKLPCGVSFPKRCCRFQDEIPYRNTIRIEPH